jgi:hypothetical protein
MILELRVLHFEDLSVGMTESLRRRNPRKVAGSL